MGFGILFIGYFLFLNLFYFAYTDIICGMVLIMGLYKLSSVNRGFFTSMIFSSGFTLFAFFEFILEILRLFDIYAAAEMTLSYMAIFRYVIISAITLCILFGIYDVAKEVDLKRLSERARKSIPFSIIFIIYAVCENPQIQTLLGPKITPYVYVAVILSTFIFIIVNLFTIYKTYMQICMPEENKKYQKENFAKSKKINK